MGAESSARAALLLTVLGLGVLVTSPPLVSPAGLGTAEARTHRHGRYRHGRRRHHGAHRRAAEPDETETVELLPPERPPELSPGGVTASLAPDGDDVRLTRLRSALQDRASNLAGEDGGSAPSVPETSAPRSISFDFETGLKTTLFANGAAVREPFDREAARRMTPPQPAAPNDRRAAAAPAP